MFLGMERDFFNLNSLVKLLTYCICQIIEMKALQKPVSRDTELLKCFLERTFNTTAILIVA